ncbi:MAG: iron-containing alcohol dehydrogenase [Promethearchaeota archaeon]
MKNFVYYQPTNIIFGWGLVNVIGKVIANLGKKCLLVTVKPFPALEPVFEKIKELCKNENVEIFHFDGVIPNPTTDCVNLGTTMAEENQIDVVLGVGGGSSIDVGKAISVGVTHEGEAWDYSVYQKPIEDKLLPIVAVTTTAGTGSEVTPVSVITNPYIPFKSALFSKLLCPKISIVDPELTVTLPPHITASTGFDAFAHSFESTLHVSSGEYTDMIALKSMELIIKYLPTAIKDGSNREAREAVSWANTLGGLAIANAGTTLPHGIGMAIGGNAPYVMHGEALAIMYPEINRFTWNSAITQYASVGRLFNQDLKNLPDEEAAEKSVDEMDKFLKKIGMWMSFKDKDVPESKLEDIIESSFKLGDYQAHPKVANKEEMTELIKKSYSR